jgi:hypothetical protein
MTKVKKRMKTKDKIKTKPVGKPQDKALECRDLLSGGRYFAAPDSWEDGGWYGPHKTRGAAIQDMLSNRNGDPLEFCVTAIGYEITPETHPDLYDQDGCISEWEWQVESTGDSVLAHNLSFSENITIRGDAESRAPQPE